MRGEGREAPRERGLPRARRPGDHSRVPQRFEDLIAWQRARDLTREISRITQDGRPRSDRALAEQMRRAAVSVMANLAEGFDRGTNRDFLRFVQMARGSCAEVRSHLHAARAAGDIDQADLDRLLAQAEEIGRVTHGLRAALASKAGVPAARA